MSKLNYYLNFSANPALFAHGGLLADSLQPDTLRLGPFDDYIDLTPNTLRLGHEGEAIATFEIGAWRLDLASVPDVQAWWASAPASGAARFTDVAITAEVTDESGFDETLGVYIELSTAHITESTDQDLAEHLLELPASASGQPRFDEGWPAVSYTGYGYFVRVPADLDEADEELLIPDDLRVLLHHAHSVGAHWLVLDRDGPTHPDLPTFNW